MSQIKFISLNQEDIDNFKPTVDKISQCIYENHKIANSKIINIVGPLASSGEKNNGHYLANESNYFLNIHSNKESIICNGLTNSKIQINNKINHLLIRECQNTSFEINNGVISGLSLIKCSNIYIKIPYQNTTIIEQTSNVNIESYVSSDTILFLLNSFDIYINNSKLPINIFDKLILKSNSVNNFSYLNVPDLNIIV